MVVASRLVPKPVEGPSAWRNGVQHAQQRTRNPEIQNLSMNHRNHGTHTRNRPHTEGSPLVEGTNTPIPYRPQSMITRHQRSPQHTSPLPSDPVSETSDRYGQRRRRSRVDWLLEGGPLIITFVAGVVEPPSVYLKAQ